MATAAGSTPTPTPIPGQITFVSAGNDVTSGGASTTAISVVAPVSIQTNDLILVQATDYFGSTVNPPDSSWHLIRTDALANHSVVRSFWHLATGAGDGPWTFSPSPRDYVSARASAWRNVDPAAPVDSANGGTTWSNANSMPSVPVTATGNNEMLVGYWSAYLATSQTLAAGLSSAYSAHDADWAMLAGYTPAPAAGVASAQYTSTSNTSTNGGAGGVILLRGTGGGATPTSSPTASLTQTPTSTASMPTPTATPTAMPSGTPTLTPNPPSPTPTVISTATPPPTATPSLAPSGTPTPTSTPTQQSTPTAGPITFVSAGADVTSGGASTTAISVVAPASIQANDLIVVQATDYFGNTVNPPDSSWHLIRTDALVNHVVVRSFWHLATGAGDGPWTFSPSPRDYVSARASAWRNVDPAAPVDSANGGITWSNANSMPSVSVTATGNNEMLVGYWSAYLATSQTPAAGLSSAYSAHDADWAMLAGYTPAPAAGVASAQYTSTSNSSTNGGAGGVILLRHLGG